MAMKMKKYEELELRDDFMFSRIMSNPKFVKPLLETILGVKIRKIVYPQTQKTIDLSLQAKGIRLDVYVEDDQNTVFKSGNADVRWRKPAEEDALLPGDDRS